MKAISLWQPWASLIAFGAKTYETRSWPPPLKLIGQRIAIHAAARKPVNEFDPEVWDALDAAFGTDSAGLIECDLLPRGAVVATVTLGAAFTTCSGFKPPDLFGDYSTGRWVWPLTNLVTFAMPVPARGRQGFFDWTPP